MAELLRRVSSHELTEWMAFDRMEPLGDRRADFRIALLGQQLARFWVEPSDREKVKLESFLLQFEVEEEVEQTPEDALRQAQQLVTAMGGRVVKESPDGG